MKSIGRYISVNVASIQNGNLKKIKLVGSNQKHNFMVVLHIVNKSML